MPDFRVRFVGDLGNLKQFDSAIRNSAGESARQIEAANLRIASRVGRVSGLFDAKAAKAGTLAAGLYVDPRTQRTIVDSYNNTFKQSGDIIRRTLRGYTAEFDEANKKWVAKPAFTDEYVHSFQERIGDVKAYEAAIAKTASTEAQIVRQQQTAARRSAAIQNEIESRKSSISGLQGAAGAIRSQLVDPLDAEPYQDKIARANKQIAQLQAGTLIRTSNYGKEGNTPFGKYITPEFLESTKFNLEAKLRAAKDTSKGPASSQKIIQEIENQIKYVDHIRDNARQNQAAGVAELQAHLAEYEAVLARETKHIAAQITKLEAEKAKLGAKDAALAAKLDKQIASLRGRNPAYAAARAALNATPPIDTNLQAALNQSKELRQRLLQGGLGAGTRPGSTEFQKALALQEAQVSRFTKNFRTNITSVEGSFREFNAKTGKLGILNNFTVDLDQNGKVVGRWGGQLSGAGAILKQTVRDFQKVIEWTLATTAVFGTLGLVIKSLSTINDLNASLTRFSITAQLSAEETKDLFSALGDVAIATATPLKDLVQVSDDIALATKKAGDSTDEWKNKILDLTTAVGIFTNLTGEDTVAGADKLSSAFKQLGVAPGDLIGVLNKVTAVAGGQSTAINEIVTALGGVAEAGRVAGLTLNEQIAAVQVLGQVTNKSAADVATAFKNLFGSLASPGSEKILKEFNIQVRDAEGNLRPFLTIYREINKALADGVIPAGRYQDVIRGISGGPRRAPDAAALLANLPAVDAAIAKAAGASNEALIANAKILDTNQAKIIQLQNAFDIALFERFGEVVKDVTDSFTGLLTQILKTFNGIDPTLIAILVQLGAVAVAGKLLGTIFKTAGLSMATSIRNVGKELGFGIQKLDAFTTKVALAERGYSYTAAGRLRGPGGQFAKEPVIGTNERIGAVIGTGGIRTGIQSARTSFSNLSSFKKALLPIGIGAGIAAADKIRGGALEGVDPQTIGSFLQLAGAVSVATGVLAPLGAAALVAGTAISFLGGETEKVKQSAAEAASEVYGITQSLQQAQADATTYTKAQQDAKKVLDSIAASGKTDAETKAAQATATTAFVDATLALANANNLVNKSFDDLLLKLDNIGPKYAAYKNIVGNARGGIDNKEVQSLADEIAAEILRASGTSTYIPKNQQDSIINPTFRQTPLTVTPIVDVNDPYTTSDYGKRSNFDPQILKNSPEKIVDLIDTSTGEFKNTYAASTENLAILAGAINQIPKLVAEETLKLDDTQIATIQKAANDFLSAQSSFFEIQSKLQGRAAQIEALGAIGGLKGQDLQNAQLRNALAQQLHALLPNADTPESRLAAAHGRGPQPTGVDAEKIIADIKRLTETAEGGIKFSVLGGPELKNIGEDLLLLNRIFPEIKSQGEAAFKEGIAKSLLAAGVPAEQLSFILKSLPGDIDAIIASEEELAAAAKRLSDAQGDALNKYAARNAALREGENSGQFKDNAKGLATLRDQSDQAYQSEINLINAINVLSGDALVNLQTQLANVEGLENASIIAKENLSAAFIDNAIKAGVNAEGIKKITAEVARLIGIITAIPAYKKVIIDLEERISVRGGGGGDTRQDLLNEKQLARAYAQEAKAQKAGTDPASIINQIIKSINKTIAGGSGSNLGSLATSAAKAAKKQPDVSQIDLPEEIANAANRSALIQEAIKRARALQKTIPGATKEGKDDIVSLLKGTQNILNVRGVKDDLLRRALEELADIEKKRLEFETKADTIRRIRIGAGDFSALANVPVNTKTGVSLGSPSGPINVTLNLNGTVLTPAQMSQFADLVAAALKRQIAG